MQLIQRKATIDASSPAAGAEGSHKWSFDVLREEKNFRLQTFLEKDFRLSEARLSAFSMIN